MSAISPTKLNEAMLACEKALAKRGYLMPRLHAHEDAGLRENFQEFLRLVGYHMEAGPPLPPPEPRNLILKSEELDEMTIEAAIALTGAGVKNMAYESSLCSLRYALGEMLVRMGYAEKDVSALYAGNTNWGKYLLWEDLARRNNILVLK